MLNLIKISTVLIVLLTVQVESQDDAPGPTRVQDVTTPPEFIEESLKIHNDYRKLHGVPPLVLNQTLTEMSQAFANKLVAAKSDDYDHNPESTQYQIGENLYFYKTTRKGKLPTPSKTIKPWYDEIQNYNFKTGEAIGDGEILHFTQIVWKETTQMGTAYATAEDPDANGYYYSFIVANYYPRANVDRFIENVPPLLTDQTDVPKPTEDKPADQKPDDGKTTDPKQNAEDKNKDDGDEKKNESPAEKGKSGKFISDCTQGSGTTLNMSLNLVIVFSILSYYFTSVIA